MLERWHLDCVRTFSFEEWNWMDDRLIHEVRQETDRKINHRVDIMGADIDAQMVGAKEMLRKRALAMTFQTNTAKISAPDRSMG